MVESAQRPDDFDQYWDAVDTNLGSLPAAPHLEPLPLRSNEHCDVCLVRLTSIGPYRISGYFSVPKGDGPFPGLLLLPGYASVHAVPDFNDRRRYVTLALMHRGQRLADQPYAAAFPGLLTDGIKDPETYIYRGIVADCLRAAELLLSRPEVDPGRVAVAGNDLALITAARRPGFTTIQAAGLLFARAMDARLRTDAYPLEELNDYLRTYPEHEKAVARTLSYLDPALHVDRIRGTTLLSTGAPGSTSGADWLAGLIDNFGGPLEQYRLTGEGRTDQDYTDAWLAQQLGVPAMSRFITSTS